MAKQVPSRQRRRIAEEAARIVVDEGVTDYHQARSKACDRLGLSGRRDRPSLQEVEDAVIVRTQLFASAEQRALLAELRQVALAVMKFLEAFEPALVGSVLKGTATRSSPVQLHLFSDDVEAVAIHLIDHGLRYHAIERRRRGERRGVPGYAFAWGGVPVEALVFPAGGLRVAPPSPIDGRPVRRASRRKLEQLMARSAAGQSAVE